MSDDGRRPRRRRALTPDERSLWSKIAETILPLSGRRMPPPPPEPVATKKAPPPAKAKIKVQPAKTPSRPLPSAKPKAPPLAALEPRLARDLRRGGAVDARLDLHGFRQDEAHDRLVRFLKSQQARGARVVLVITGKGRPDDGAGSFDERGVLRRLVPAWLSETSLRTIVLGFSEASAAHGGAGALYVRLRRER